MSPARKIRPIKQTRSLYHDLAVHSSASDEELKEGERKIDHADAFHEEFKGGESKINSSNGQRKILEERKTRWKNLKSFARQYLPKKMQRTALKTSGCSNRASYQSHHNSYYL